MVAGAAADDSGHLILADWIEENLDAGDLAATLRASGDDSWMDGPMSVNTSYRDFRWRQLDGSVLLYMASYHVWLPYKRGEKPKQLEGQLLGFLVRGNRTAPMARWVRWLPSDAQTEESARLWEDLGVNVPAPPATER
jgi:hypothetical protein